MFALAAEVGIDGPLEHRLDVLHGEAALVGVVAAGLEQATSLAVVAPPATRPSSERFRKFLPPAPWTIVTGAGPAASGCDEGAATVVGCAAAAAAATAARSSALSAGSVVA
jgi:hypothetical protein